MSADIVHLTPRSRPPRRTGWVHVNRLHDGTLEVIHESASGNSFGPIRQYPGDQLEQAVIDALHAAAGDYRPARLGLVATPLELDPNQPSRPAA